VLVAMQGYVLYRTGTMVGFGPAVGWVHALRWFSLGLHSVPVGSTLFSVVLVPILG
jgi:hypothetical protein